MTSVKYVYKMYDNSTNDNFEYVIDAYAIMIS